MPPATSCSCGDRESVAIRDAWTLATPTPTNNNRIVTFKPTIQFSALPIHLAPSKFSAAVSGAR